MRARSAGRRTRSTFSSIVSVTIGNLAAPLAAFASGPILAHGLGVSGRGEVAAGSALLLLFTSIGALGVPDAATYFVAARILSPKDVLRRGTVVLLLSGALLTVAGYFLAPVVASDDPQLTWVIRVAGFAILPTLLVGTLRGIAQGAHRWTLVNLEKYVTAFFRVVPLLALLVAGLLTPFSAVLVLAAAPVVAGFSYLGLIRGSTAAVGRPDKSARLLSYGARVWIGALSGTILVRLDQTILAPLAGVHELGLYAVAVNLSDLLLVAHSAISLVLFASDAQESRDERMYLGSRLSILVNVMLGIAIGAPVVLWLSLLFGNGFIPAAPAVLILLLGNIVGTPGSLAGTAMSARGHPGYRSASIVIAAVVNATLVVVLSPPLGAVGAALAMLTGSLIGSGMNLYFGRRYFGLSVIQFCVPRWGDVRHALAAFRQHRNRQPL